MIQGKTKTGFEFTIEDEALNDMRVMDALMSLDDFDDEDNGSAAKATMSMSKVASLLLGKKQKEKLYKHIEASHGKVDMTAFIEEMVDILSSNNESKN